MDARSAPKIGRAIKRARERSRMSQAEAAAALGVSRSALNAWENDRAYPRSSIGALEQLYRISLDDGPEPLPAMPEGLRADLLNADGLTPDERQAVIEAVENALARKRGGEASSRRGESGAEPERFRPASLSGVPCRG